MRYFIGFLVTFGLIVLIIVLLIGGGGKKPINPTAKPLSLVDYANASSAAQIIIDGPVVADQNHKTLKINVNKDETTLTIYNGYEQNVVNTYNFSNNTTGYAIFLQSIQRAGFTLHDTKIGYDERGFCPNGERYIFEFINDGTDLRRSWSTTCGTAIGSAKGQISVILTLFKAQVPDFTKLTGSTQLY